MRGENGFLVSTVQVAQEMESLHETVHLLWTFDVPWHWAYVTKLEPWMAQFAFQIIWMKKNMKNSRNP